MKRKAGFSFTQMESGEMANAITQEGLSGKKTGGAVVKWVSKWPQLVYRFHLGWILGARFMLVTHRGRRTGKLWQTGVMVLRYDEQTQEASVVAGSRGADWYRNIQASPAVEITLGSQRYYPMQRFLNTDEIAELMAYSRRHSPFTAFMQGLFFGWPWKATQQDLLILAAQLGGVAFRPASPSSAMEQGKGS